MLSSAIDARPAILEDADTFAPLLRQQDKAELQALLGHTDYRWALAYSIAESSDAWTLHTPEGPALVCGVSPYTYLGDVGVPWMLATENAVRHRHALMRLAPQYIARMLARFPQLCNLVHEANTISVRWLARMGFEFTNKVLVRGEPFLVFRLTKG